MGGEGPNKKGGGEPDKKKINKQGETIIGTGE